MFLARAVGLFMTVLVALPASAQLLAPLSDRIDPDAAQVLLVWTPGASHGLATGSLRPGGRPAETGDRFLLASVTKPYVAAALLRLHDLGRIDIRGPAAPWLPQEVVAGLGGLDGVRIDHLLTMTSGLPEYLLEDFAEDWEAAPQGWTALRALSYAYGEVPYFAPGEDFDYSNTNYLLAQLILERVTGTGLEAALRSLVLEPAGAARTGLVGMRPHGPQDVAGLSDGQDVSAAYVSPGFGDGGLVAPASDVAAFFRALLIDRRLLTPETLAMMLEDPLGEGYGMGIVIDDSDFGPIYGHSGGDLGFSTNVWVLPWMSAIGVLLRGDEHADEGLLWQALDLVLSGG